MKTLFKAFVRRLAGAVIRRLSFDFVPRVEFDERVAALDVDTRIAELQRQLAEVRREAAALGSASFLEMATSFSLRVQACREGLAEAEDAGVVERMSREWRRRVRLFAGLAPTAPDLTFAGDAAAEAVTADLCSEIGVLRTHATAAASVFKALAQKRVLYAGQSYYNGWYLSRSLREFGWKADVLNWDTNPATQIYYHGEDVRFDANDPFLRPRMLAHYVASLYEYDVFHFSNNRGISFGWPVHEVMAGAFGEAAEIHLIKALGKPIAYTNNGCADGVSQTSFSRWGPESVCAICRWRNEPSVCSDQRNLEWGRFRNSVADYQCTLGGNRADYNDDPRVHESPEFHCLDSQLWRPGLDIPQEFRLPPAPPGTVRLYHAVGHRQDRTSSDGVNIKSSHVYLPLIERLQSEGLPLELLEPTGIPNRDVRFIQAQADIFLDMLTYGWFGATAREAMMLGKPVVCFIRPEWLRSVAEEVPEYAAELPVISATPGTIEAILRDLIANPAKRLAAGERGRAFAVKWHSAQAGARRFDEIYARLLQGDPLLRQPARPTT